MVAGDATVPRSGRQALWPADTSVPLSEQPIGSLLARQAALTPNRPAVVEWVSAAGAEDGRLRTLTYGELLEAAHRVARGLLADARSGDRVAVWGPSSIEWVVIEFAVALAGLVLVPLNPALTECEAEDLLPRSGGAAVDGANLEAYARDSLAGYKVPRIWRAVDEFPLTASGKVQKFRLREALT